MPNYDRATPELISQLVFEYRRFSSLLRQVYLDDTDEPIDIDEMGKRFAKRGTVVGTLASIGQRSLIARLSEEDHLYWRLAVLQRELEERGATPRDVMNDSTVKYLNEQISINHHVIKSIIGKPQKRSPKTVKDDDELADSGTGTT